MTRALASTLFVLASLALGGCGDRPSSTPEGAPDDRGWVMPPAIEAATSSGGDIRFRGRASPLGRVVVTGPEGQAFAVAADAEGRFDLRIPRPPRDALFGVEARAGQLGYPAPYRLLVAADPAGPIALLSPGTPSRRLDAAGPLDAIDVDGDAVLVSGRASPGALVEVEAGGPRQVRSGSDGRWVLALQTADANALRFGAISYAPVLSRTEREGVLEPTPGGWRIAWSTPAGARQTTWFPARR